MKKSPTIRLAPNHKSCVVTKSARNMPTGNNLVRLRDRNINGQRPPSGCTLTCAAHEPKVAVPQKSLGPWEASLLTHDKHLIAMLASVVHESATLKTWFAFWIKTGNFQRRGNVSLWTPVWSLIRDKGAMWVARYDSCVSRETQWEFGEPTTIVELWARTLCAIYCNVKDNPSGDEERVHGLTWHPYYYEPEGRYFLLYKLLKFVMHHLGVHKSETVFYPTDPDRVFAWPRSYAGQIRRSTDQFVLGECTRLTH